MKTNTELAVLRSYVEEARGNVRSWRGLLPSSNSAVSPLARALCAIESADRAPIVTTCDEELGHAQELIEQVAARTILGRYPLACRAEKKAREALQRARDVAERTVQGSHFATAKSWAAYAKALESDADAKALLSGAVSAKGAKEVFQILRAFRGEACNPRARRAIAVAIEHAREALWELATEE